MKDDGVNMCEPWRYEWLATTLFRWLHVFRILALKSARGQDAHLKANPDDVVVLLKGGTDIYAR